MRYSIKDEGGVLIATLEEKYPRSKPLRNALSEILKRVGRHGCVVLDLGDALDLDAAGAGAVLQWLEQVRTKVDGVGLCARHASLLALLELVGAHGLVQIFDAPATAVDRMRRHLRRPEPEKAMSAASS
jgi:anti-anti-sigma regulatory factor